MSHEIVVCGVPFESGAAKDALKKLKDIGVTSVQIYVFWKNFEPHARGKFDWSFYDGQVELIEEAGLKFVPFILMGPRYAAPQWWLDSDKHRGLYCLEHNKYSPIESIWNPYFREEISRVLQAFAEHYVPKGVLESIQPGICGDYGEAIFPVTGNWPGAYHTHGGYWCGGEDAKQSFRTWLKQKYTYIEALNKAWRTSYQSVEDINPFLPHRAPSRTAYFDMLDWYRDSMTEYSEFWLVECRKYFPDTPVYLCTGGNEEPEHGSLFSSQARVAAKHGCGIRLTNEGNKFYDNFFGTAYTKSACDFYGAYLGLEPVGPMTDKGVVARIFGSAAYGNNQIFHYYGNLFDKDNNYRPSAQAVKKYLPLIKQRKTGESVAFFWPNYYAAYHGGMPDNTKHALSYIRKRTNCMPVNEEMIMDGVLSRHKLLIIPFPGFTTREVLLKICDWVKEGGTVLSVGLMKDLEMNCVDEYNEIFGILPDSEETWGICTQHIQNNEDFPELSKLQSYTSRESWVGLKPDTILLSHTKPMIGYSDMEIKKTSAAFYRKEGKGTAIFYGGPVSFEDDPEALFKDPGIFRALLNDVLKHYSKTVDLTPAEDEVARAEIDGAIYALKDGEIIKV